MPDFSLLGGANRTEEGGADATDSGGVTITSSASTHTKGAYGQLIASTGFNAYGIYVMHSRVDAGEYLIDVAVGGAGSEQVKLPNLMSNGTKTFMGSAFFFPVHIAAGSRVSARAQSNGSSKTVDVTVLLVGTPFPNPSALGRVTAYGINTADTGAVGVDPGGTANTKGSYAEIDASIANSIRLIYIAFGVQNNGVRTSAFQLLDIAVGAAASEQIIIPDLFVLQNAGDDRLVPSPIGPLPVNIPAGTRVAARAQSSIIDASDRLFDVAIYGVD